MSEPAASGSPASTEGEAWALFHASALAIHREDPLGAAERYHDTVVRWVRALAQARGEAPSDALLIAAMCQHVRRWSLPRDTYPRTTPGYKRWRSELGRMHARTANELAVAAGFPADVAARASEIILHKALRRDAEGMHLEDAACLTFLELELAAFAARHAEDEVLTILRKTWGKMSDAGQAAALRALDAGALDATSSALLRRALS